MIVPFRQGIVRYPTTNNQQSFLQKSGNSITLSTANGQVDFTFAHKAADYFHTEAATVPGAWVVPPSNPSWIYIDINTTTGHRSFGWTTVQPFVGSSVTDPVDGMHWFDTNNNVMKERVRGIWRERIRVFVAHVQGENFISMSAGFGGLAFAGTQIGQTVDTKAGRIVFDELGKPIVRSAGEFMTTETQFYVSGTRVNVVSLESTVVRGIAGSALPAYHVAKVMPDGTLQLGGYNDAADTMFVFVTENATIHQSVPYVIQGVISNPVWNFSGHIGKPLWVKESGQLVAIDPSNEDNMTYPKAYPPIARVLSADTIVFGK